MKTKLLTYFLNRGKERSTLLGLAVLVAGVLAPLLGLESTEDIGVLEQAISSGLGLLLVLFPTTKVKPAITSTKTK